MSAKSNSKTEKAVKKNSFFGFFREVKAEFKQITWPSKQETKKNLIAVIVFTVIFILVIGGMDLIFKNLFELVFGLK